LGGGGAKKGTNTSPIFFLPKNIFLDTELKRGKEEVKKIEIFS